MGLSLDVHRNPTIESDIIIGHLDTGVIPEIESLSDDGLSDVPTKWRGACLGGKNFTCNKKLIGARYYIGDSARDVYNHGTHTASTAVGRVAKKAANYFGIANGTARGGVPSARIATYKLCQIACDVEDILAAFDDAIADNVDIITISLGSNEVLNIIEDPVAIGSFHALKKGILTVQAAGNSNGKFFTIISLAPWLFTVAASSTDRKIINKLILGNRRNLISIAVNPFSTGSHNKKLVYGRGITKHCNESSAMQCMDGCIDPHLVKGKIIMCDVDSYKSFTLESASGLIVRKGKLHKDDAENAPFPTAFLSDSDFRYVESYFKSKRMPCARIKKSETIHYIAPIVASFSSRGPNKFLSEIFKPDITAPGMNILAESPTKTDLAFGEVGAKYNFESGTSMACPHVSGAAAYVKSMHPDWSPSAIKSSLMTTAWTLDKKYNVDAELSYGAGHIDPVKAIHPGLVYETLINDYINMLCMLSSEGDKLIKMVGAKTKCSKEKRTSLKDLNYPAMTAPVHSNLSFTVQFSRVVTNVGHANSTYEAQISTGDNAIYISVEPSVLSFVRIKEKKKFTVTISGKWGSQNHISCSLIWFDGTHRVRSPIILYKSSLIHS
ncbi:subtilisin-like protease SBT4.3 [Impatiens glandulifera]|uniref:subtilisin-like protease SBT4.3 n=1 Tax=Impatiens glandulifera TaxID=253017 RepID=UPI001FB07FE9|nr:subtilisin-like protease SBT4.3 [Impatiens glandulifera]